MNQHLTTWKERNQKQLKWLGLGFVLFLIASIFIYCYKELQQQGKEELKKEKPQVVVTSPQPKQESNVVSEKGWMVDIKGEVTTPGTYAVSDEMRIIDVVQLAGGLTKQADTSILNLSQKVADQMVIIIYSKSQVEQMKQGNLKENELLKQCQSELLLKNDACIKQEEQKESPKGKVNINTASKEILLTLNGIGAAKVDAIIAYRNNKKFETIEELLEVPGIGESILAGIKEYLTLE